MNTLKASHLLQSDAYTFDALATAAADVIAFLGSGPAHVVGISVGGMVAQTLAVARQPSCAR